jgi:hypothetical protein
VPFSIITLHLNQREQDKDDTRDECIADPDGDSHYEVLQAAELEVEITLLPLSFESERLNDGVPIRYAVARIPVCRRLIVF